MLYIVLLALLPSCSMNGIDRHAYNMQIFVGRKAGIYFIPRRRVVLAQWCAAVTCEPCCLTVTFQAAQKSLSYSLVLSCNGGSVGLVAAGRLSL